MTMTSSSNDASKKPKEAVIKGITNIPAPIQVPVIINAAPNLLTSEARSFIIYSIKFKVIVVYTYLDDSFRQYP
jgi:hypothetical protein